MSSGQYASPAEVIYEALALLGAYQDHDRVKLAALRSAIQEGLNSGASTPLDMDTIIANARNRFSSGE